MLSVGLVILGIKDTSASDALRSNQIPLLGTAIYVEGIACSAKRSTYFVSSTGGGSIQEIGKTKKLNGFKRQAPMEELKAWG